MKIRILYKVNSIVITSIFIISIFIPFTLGVIEKDKDNSEIEMRRLSKRPVAPKNADAIRGFPELFNTYYSDHFGLRGWFTKYYKLIKYKIGDSPSKDVTIGKNGWLFLGSIKNGYNKHSDPIGDARNVNLYSLEDLKRFSKHINGLKAWLNERGIEYVFVIAPNKHTIYSEELPNYITKVNEKSATDQLFEYLIKHTKVTTVDLRASLMREKEKHDIYNKTGTHWNHYGANVAQYEIMKAIYNIFPEKISPSLLSDSMFKFNISDDRDLERLSGIKIMPLHTVPIPILKDSCTPKKRVYDTKGKQKYTMICKDQKLNAVIFRDSFFDDLQPYFSRKFKRSTYISEKLNFPTLVKYIELEKPDVVIEEWVERILPHIPNIEYEFNRSLNKDKFYNSDKLIFSNDWELLNYNHHINIVDNKNNFINLISIGNDPNIVFPLLNFIPNKKYMLYFSIASSVKSTLQIFYSDSSNARHLFSEKNSVIVEIKKGENDVYVSLDYSNIGKHLRLDPISGKGEVIIKTLEIKEVE